MHAYMHTKPIPPNAIQLTSGGLHACAGRQARERARLVSIVKKQRQIEDKRSRMGVPLSHEEAARRIQAAMRGFIWRRRIKEISDQELQFIGMKPKVAEGGRDARQGKEHGERMKCPYEPSSPPSRPQQRFVGILRTTDGMAPPVGCYLLYSRVAL